MTNDMTLRSIWRYPVKSMAGATVTRAELSVLGIVGDRHWAVRSLEIGGIRGAKKIGGLMTFAAGFTGDDGTRVAVTLPDGTTVNSDDVDVNERISAALGHRVVLESLPADGNLDHFRRGPSTNTDPVQDLRDVFGREDGEPLPDFSAFPPEVVEFESPPGTHYDCWPLMVMTTSALRALESALPGSNVDVRRFRPSLVVDTDEPGHPEFSWTGRTATIGASARVEFLKPCPRCVMTTREVRSAAGGVIPADRAVLRHIVRDLDQNLGVYARVVTPGVIHEGDPVRFD